MPRDPAANLFLALDQGGHASRALVFDSHGRILTRALRDVQEFHPRPEWIEQDPEELVSSLTSVIREVEADLGARARDIAAAGLATQRSSIVCWDRLTGEALSPVLSWQDRRAHDWLERFRPHAPVIRESTGLVLSAHYGVSKLRWCLDHLPAVERAASQQRLAIGPLSSFLTYRLTEERPCVADPANAARTLLWNLQRQDWDDRLLHLFNVPRRALPDCVPNRFGFGRLAGGHRPPLTVVTGDQSAALFSGGQPETSLAYVNAGTGAFVQRIVNRFPGTAAPLLNGLVYRDAVDSVFTLEGTVNGAGSALTWAQSEPGMEDLPDRLDDWLKVAVDPPLFINGIGGLGSPFWIPDFQSRWLGDGEAAARAVAVVESILFLIQVNVAALDARLTPATGIVISGGLVELDGFGQRMSDLSGLPVYRPAEHEATARGLAWLLAERPGLWPEIQPGAAFAPRPNPGLRTRFDRWRASMMELTGI